MKNLTAIIFAVAIVISAFLLGKSYVDRAKPLGNISVTDLGNADFTSDLIVWEGEFSRFNTDLSEAFAGLKNDREKVKTYLTNKGIGGKSIVFLSVNTYERKRSEYFEGKYIGERFEGYELSQRVKIESSDVELVESVSREITELLNQGVQFRSYSPRYYYTKLADLKIEMISQATEDAKNRADQIAVFSGAKLGKLISARMGVFQITGQNSGEEFSWGGNFNTSDKNKTASITMRLEYDVK